MALVGLVPLAGGAAERLEHDPAVKFSPREQDAAMPELPSSRVGKILQRYYMDGLGGVDGWKRIESLRVEGLLKLSSGEHQLKAYQKKPDLLKITVGQAGQSKLILAYDGETAWQQLAGAEQAVVMDEVAARRFVHSAHFGNHLLYPYAKGKVVEYVDTVPVGTKVCHQLRVTLPNAYQVDYFIDIRTYLEVKVVNTDLRTEVVNTVEYADYVRRMGMPIARRVESFENGEWVSSLELSEVRVNAGVMPWMFAMPE